MQIWEIILIGAALAMDAFAVSLTNGMAEPRMKAWKVLAIAATYAVFQCVMPILGYYLGYAFSALVEKIAPWLSFALLFLIGGKAIIDAILEKKRGRKEPKVALGAGKLLLQGVATSLDALAVGVTLLAAETDGGLPFHVVFCALIIGAVTFLLSLGAVEIGRKTGDALEDKEGIAEIAGGVILIAIGIKILLEGLL